MFAPQPYLVLIDDDPDDLEMLTSSLEPMGIKIKTFDAGDKALLYLNSIARIAELPYLVILDYNMPRSNGEEVLLLIKKNKQIRHIPVVIYSTSMSPICTKALIDFGAFRCYRKPISYKEFIAQASLFKDLAFSLANPEIAI
jgi:CheY-like chemotaxis protein